MLNQSWHKIKTFQGIPAVKDKYSDTVSLCKHLLLPPGKKRILISNMWFSFHRICHQTSLSQTLAAEISEVVNYPALWLHNTISREKPHESGQPGRNKVRSGEIPEHNLIRQTRSNFILFFMKGNQNFLIFTPIDFCSTAKKKKN